MKLTGEKGPWRVYFNKHGEAPRVWSIAPDRTEATWEVECRAVVISGCSMATVYQPVDKNAAEYTPSAYFIVHGRLTLESNGLATFEPS